MKKIKEKILSQIIGIIYLNKKENDINLIESILNNSIFSIINIPKYVHNNLIS